MKIFFILIFAAGLSVGCGNEKNVRISGNLSGSDGEKILLQELAYESSARIDTVQISAQGNFSFKRKIAQPTFYSLTVNDNAITILAHPGERIVVSGDARNLALTYSVKGSEDSRQIRQLSQRLEHTVFIRDSLIRTLRAFEGNRNFVNIQRQFDWTYINEVDSLRAYNIRFIENNPHSLVVIYALYQQLDQNNLLFSRDEDIRYFLRADSFFYRRFPKVPYVNMLRADAVQMNETYNTLRLNRMLFLLGEEAPEIALPAPDGNIVRLSSTRGKYVLIDFWASWSPQCRAENINLLNVYNKYRDRGFEYIRYR